MQHIGIVILDRNQDPTSNIVCFPAVANSRFSFMKIKCLLRVPTDMTLILMAFCLCHYLQSSLDIK